MDRNVPPPYDAVLNAIEFEVGIVFDGTFDNVRALAKRLRWSPEQVRSAIGVMVNRGLIREERIGNSTYKRWTVVAKAA